VTPNALLRSSFRHPALSATIVATLALGVAVATALFTYLDVYLHPHLNAPAAERVAEVWFGSDSDARQQASSVELDSLRRREPFRETFGASPIGASLGATEGSRYAWGQLVSGSYFPFFAARPALGRLLAPADDRPGAPPVVVLGHGIWQSDFGGDPAVVGRAVRVNGAQLTVVGVAPPGFTGLGYATGFFAPLAQADAVSGVARLGVAEERWLRVVTRLPRGTWLAAAGEALAAVARELDRSAPLEEGPRKPLLLAATTFDPASREDPFFHAATALTAAAVLFLLLGSANVAGLLLARAAAREREWAMRKALGAAPRRLVGALAGELAFPAAAGLAGALLVAVPVVRWLERMLLTPIGGLGPGWAATGEHVLALGGRAYAFAAIAALVTIALAALPPLVRVLRDDPIRALRSGDARSGARLGPRQIMVALELALAVVLLVGGTLLARTLRSAVAADLGFDARGLSIATVHQPRAGARPAPVVWNALLEEVRRLPGVRSATLAHVGPNAGWTRWTRVATDSAHESWRDTEYNLVSTRYFSTLGVPIAAGRALDERDAPGAPASVVVSRTLAETLFPHQSAIGRHLRADLPVRAGDSGPDFEIVGVAADAATTSALAPHAPTVYFAYGQRSHSRMSLLVRGAAPLSTLEPGLRRALAAAAPEAAVVDLVDAHEQLLRSLHPLRINATLAVALAAMGLATAVAGLLALQVFAVSLRRRELGVRLALGARERQLARLVLGDSARLAAAGALAGVAGALALTRLLSSLLFGVAAVDPWTLVLVPLALVAVVLVAGLVPAYRAMRTNPAEVLRSVGG
jgi:predicted permease